MLWLSPRAGGDLGGHQESVSGWPRTQPREDSRGLQSNARAPVLYQRLKVTMFVRPEVTANFANKIKLPVCTDGGIRGLSRGGE